MLGGSWVVKSRVISRVTIVITYVRGLRTLLLTAHEPPSVSSSATPQGRSSSVGTFRAKDSWVLMMEAEPCYGSPKGPSITWREQF